MPDKQELKIYVELTPDDIIAGKTQEAFDAIAEKKYQEELINALGTDYSYYAEVKVIKTEQMKREDNTIVIECIVEVTSKPEGVLDLFNVMERLPIGI
jgi:hypothetical protein